MRVKRYVVDSMPDALQRIRTDLGKDAVILNTKEVRSGGFLGMFGKKKIEVIAAIDSSVSPAGPPKKDLNSALKQVSEVAAAMNRKQSVAVLDQRMPYVPDVMKANDNDIPIVPPPLQRVPRTAPQPMADVSRPAASPIVAEKAPANVEAVVVRERPSAGQEKARPPEQANKDELLQEIRLMKAMMSKLSLAGAGVGGPPLDPVLEKLDTRLREQEVADDIVKAVLEAVQERAEAGGHELTSSFVRQTAKEVLLQLIPDRKGYKLSEQTRLAHFVGPTGVGKTTTIAKMAAEQVIKHKRKVGFITSDTYRIAAVEQLKTYATILDIPLEVVSSPLDLRKAYERLEHCELVLMDTAGRNFRNELYVSELNALLQQSGQTETFLVLGLTSKYRDMHMIASNFTKYGIEKVLFTKMDETDTYGPVINLIREYPLKLSYLTNGQNVPEDIALAEGGKIIDLILGDDADE
ncbi:flagellar biosynthesis protein FlhF [Paenibacillus sp. MBLB4367]|uniref:flagellar biosynthesis protein FlhF n=1 Tax=Paenibacillus sp. MBLB4367 TaxID=3384767 RepID=UPI0039082C1F